MSAGEWQCLKCKCWNRVGATKCSWCSTDKGKGSPKAGSAVSEEKLISDCRQAIIKTVHNLKPGQLQKLYKWMEDNFL